MVRFSVPSGIIAISRFAAQGYDTYTAGSAGWYQAPEPTGAMLMMFGLGLMALKRKRA